MDASCHAMPLKSATTIRISPRKEQSAYSHQSGVESESSQRASITSQHTLEVEIETAPAKPASIPKAIPA